MGIGGIFGHCWEELGSWWGGRGGHHQPSPGAVHVVQVHLHWWKLTLILFSCSFSFLLKPKYERQWKTLWIGCSWWSVGSVHDVFLMWSSSTSWGNSDLAAHQCKSRWLTPKLGVCHPILVVQLAHSQLCSLDDNLVEQQATCQPSWYHLLYHRISQSHTSGLPEQVVQIFGKILKDLFPCSVQVLIFVNGHARHLNN